jgi:hypothetical protein
MLLPLLDPGARYSTRTFNNSKIMNNIKAIDMASKRTSFIPTILDYTLSFSGFQEEECAMVFETLISYITRVYDPITFLPMGISPNK